MTDDMPRAKRLKMLREAKERKERIERGEAVEAIDAGVKSVAIEPAAADDERTGSDNDDDDDNARDKTNQSASSTSTTEELATVDAANPAVVDNDDDEDEAELLNLAPKRANWDIERDIAPMLKKLEKRTQYAIAEILRTSLHSVVFMECVDARVCTTNELCCCVNERLCF